MVFRVFSSVLRVFSNGSGAAVQICFRAGRDVLGAVPASLQFGAHGWQVGQLLQQMATLDDASRHRAQTTTQGSARGSGRGTARC